MSLPDMPVVGRRVSSVIICLAPRERLNGGALSRWGNARFFDTGIVELWIMQNDPLKEHREYLIEMENDLSELQEEFLVMEKEMDKVQVIIKREQAIEASMNAIISVPKDGMPWTAVCEDMLSAEYDRLAKLKVKYDGLVKKKEMLADMISQYDQERTLKESSR